jgi:hypothetical protein
MEQFTLKQRKGTKLRQHVHENTLEKCVKSSQFICFFITKTAQLDSSTRVPAGTVQFTVADPGSADGDQNDIFQ